MGITAKPVSKMQSIMRKMENQLEAERKAAKNAVIMTLSESININELDLVWFAHELGYKKCTIWGRPMGNRYAEVTYNRDKDEMYIDIYQKITNQVIGRDEFNFEA